VIPKKHYSSAPINPEWYAPITPRNKQWEAHAAACAHIRGPVKTEPAFIYASVGFGKTILLAMVAKQAQMVAEQRGTQQLKILVLARTGDLIDQNAEKMWEISARNSIYSASLGIGRINHRTVKHVKRILNFLLSR
jgi:superfamily II DNA or RNA helicase